jgi:small subunit ribosomal protein S16
MAVKIRLRRMGAKKAPFYRIVLPTLDIQEMADLSKKSVIMIPKEPSVVSIDAEKAKKWMANGAQPTDTVKRLFDKNGIK